MIRLIILVVLLTIPFRAAERPPKDEMKERLDAVAAEVRRRANLRKEAEAAEANARRLVREHEAGTKKATDSELAEARALLREVEVAKAKANAPHKPPNPNDPIELLMEGADMETVATAYRYLFGTDVRVSDRVKPRGAMIKFRAATLAEAREMFVAALRESGIHVVQRSGTAILDVAPTPQAK